jgi:hypothetical protein
MSMTSGRRRRQLTLEEKWEVFVEVTSQQLIQRDAARRWGVDVSVIIKPRKLAKDAGCGLEAWRSEGEDAVSVEGPVRELLHRRAKRSFDEFGLVDAAGVETGAAAAHVAVVSDEAVHHPVEVVVAVRDLLSIDGGGHGVAHEEHGHVDVVALGHCASEPEGVERLFGAVGRG